MWGGVMLPGIVNPNPVNPVYSYMHILYILYISGCWCDVLRHMMHTCISRTFSFWPPLWSDSLIKRCFSIEKKMKALLNLLGASGAFLYFWTVPGPFAFFFPPFVVLAGDDDAAPRCNMLVSADPNMVSSWASIHLGSFFLSSFLLLEIIDDGMLFRTKKAVCVRNTVGLVSV